MLSLLTTLGLIALTLILFLLLYARGIAKSVEAPFWTVVADLLRVIWRKEFF